MSDDPKRLLEDHDGGDLQSLLQAGKSELPDDRQLAAIALKLGIAGGLGGAGAAGAAGGGGIGAKAAFGGAAKAALAIKIGGAVAVAAAIGTGAVVVTTRAPEPTPTPIGIVATAPTTSSVLVPTAGPLLPHVDDTPPIPSASQKTATKPAPSAKAEDEVKMLERAQDALRSRPADALAICDDHARTYPRGMLAQEREVIAIEALVRSGRKTDARTRAERFEKAFPGSSHTRRIQNLVE